MGSLRNGMGFREGEKREEESSKNVFSRTSMNAGSQEIQLGIRKLISE